VINLGWSTAQLQDFYDICKHSHRVYTAVHQLDLSHNFQRDLSGLVIGGQVDVDRDAAITRSAKLQLMDVEHNLNFDAFNPADGANYFTQMIRIYYGVSRFEPGSPVYWVPVMTGPIDDVQRDGWQLNLSITGKEVFAKSGMWQAWSWPAGWSKNDVIANAMQIHTGEVFFNFDWTNATITAPFSLEAGDDLFENLRQLADDSGYQLFYDGWGNLRLRWQNSNMIFTFTDDWLTDTPSVDYDASKVVNAVRYEGWTPPGYTTPLAITVTAPDWHPFSPAKMGRNGVARYLPDFVSDSSINNTFVLFIYAFNVLDREILEGVNVQFSSLIMPLLEEGDTVLVNGSGYNGKTNMTQMSIPLVGDAEMSVGFLSMTGSRPYLGKRDMSVILPTKKGKGKKRKGNQTWTSGGGPMWEPGPGSVKGKRKRKRRRR
jgi:hypothetical protein